VAAFAHGGDVEGGEEERRADRVRDGGGC